MRGVFSKDYCLRRLRLVLAGSAPLNARRRHEWALPASEVGPCQGEIFVRLHAIPQRRLILSHQHSHRVHVSPFCTTARWQSMANELYVEQIAPLGQPSLGRPSGLNGPEMQHSLSCTRIGIYPRGHRHQSQYQAQSRSTRDEISAKLRARHAL